jgi:hypothetical protein
MPADEMQDEEDDEDNNDYGHEEDDEDEMHDALGEQESEMIYLR